MRNYTRIYKHRPGFTLIEACIGLIIIGFIIMIVDFAIPTIKKHPTLNNPVNLTWQNMIWSLEETNNAFKWIEIIDGGKSLKLTRSVSARKEYVLKMTKSTNALYLSGENGGYMPIVFNVKQVMFQERQHRIWIKVVYKDGGSNEAYLLLEKQRP